MECLGNGGGGGRWRWQPWRPATSCGCSFGCASVIPDDPVRSEVSGCVRGHADARPVLAEVLWWCCQAEGVAAEGYGCDVSLLGLNPGLVQRVGETARAGNAVRQQW